MNKHFLIVDNNYTHHDQIKKQLDIFGYTYDIVTSQDEAIDWLDLIEYRGFIVNLNIPESCKASSSPQNGQNLIEYLRSSENFSNTPIIALIPDYSDLYYVAYSNKKDHHNLQANSYIPFNLLYRKDALRNELDRVINSGDISKRILPFEQDPINNVWKNLIQMSESVMGTKFAKVREKDTEDELTQFTHGELAFSTFLVTLNGLVISKNYSLRRQILEILQSKDEQGHYKSYTSAELANQIGNTSRNTVTSSIKKLRKCIAKNMKSEAHIKCGLLDVIITTVDGYRLSERITTQTNINQNDHLETGALNHEQSIIQKLLKEKGRVNLQDLRKALVCSDSTIKRNLRQMKDVQYVGPRNGGYYTLNKFN